MIAVAVSHVELARGFVDDHVGGRSEILGVVAASIFAGMADLQQELAARGELQNLRVLLPGTGDPDIIPGIDIDSMFEVRPLVPFAGAAPGSEEIAGRIELQHRGRAVPSGAGFVGL